MHVFWNYFFSCNSNKDLYNVCCDFIIIQVFNQIPDTNTFDKCQEVKMNVQFMKKKTKFSWKQKSQNANIIA